MAEYLSRTGSIIVILTLLFVAVILATQFSFGRFFSAVFSFVAGRRRGRRGTIFVSAPRSAARRSSGAR